jgi:hypothetical protein
VPIRIFTIEFRFRDLLEASICQSNVEQIRLRKMRGYVEQDLGSEVKKLHNGDASGSRKSALNGLEGSQDELS